VGHLELERLGSEVEPLRRDCFVSGVEVCYLILEGIERITAWFDGDVVKTDRLRTITLNVDPEVREVPDLVGTDNFCWVAVESDAVAGLKTVTHKSLK